MVAFKYLVVSKNENKSVLSSNYICLNTYKVNLSRILEFTDPKSAIIYPQLTGHNYPVDYQNEHKV